MASSMTDGRTARTYGVVERGTAESAIAQLAEHVKLAGYAVLPGGFSAAEIADLSVRLDRVMERQIEEFGADRLAAIGATLTARCPPTTRRS